MSKQNQSFLSKVGDFFSGGLGSTIVETVKDYFPPSMSEQEKANLSMVIKTQTDKQTQAMAKLAIEEERLFNDRIKDLEGTAADLKAMPVLGPIVVFARGCQRPIWGFGTMYMDYNVFSGNWTLAEGTQESAFWVINFLVLGFLFGERALKNAAPFIAQFMGKK